MKNLKTFDEFLNESTQLNEIKGSFTSTAKADKIIDSVESALKGGLFFKAELGNKLYMKEGGKRPVAAEKFRKTLVITSNSGVKDLGKEIEFEYNYTTFRTERRNLIEMDEKEYLDYRLGLIFNQMYSNSSSDWDRSAEAAAAGTFVFKPSDNVAPWVDCGFIVWFAKNYRIDLKSFMSKQRYTFIGYEDVIRYSEKYPYKK
jgi:hypothetical protein